MDKTQKIEYIMNALQAFNRSKMKEHLDKGYGVNVIRTDMERYDEIAQFVLENLK